jgi:hypothetical protein
MPLWAPRHCKALDTLTRSRVNRYGHVTIIWLGRRMPRQKLRSPKSSISIRKSDTSHDSVVVTAVELGEVVGIDLETVNNWLRRGIIRRASVGGRQLRNRLFSTDEVYKAALTNELVQLGIAPSPSSDAVKELWKEWEQAKLPNGGNVYAMLFSNKSVALCWQKRSGGSLCRLSKSLAAEPIEFDPPREAFAVIPISNVVADLTKRLAQLRSDDETNGRQRKTSVGC